MAATAEEVEALRRALYARPSDAARVAYVAALDSIRLAEEDLGHTRALQRGRQRRRRWVVFGAALGSVVVVAGIAALVQEANRTARLNEVLLAAQGTRPYASCASVVPDHGLVVKALGSGAAPSLNDLSWLRGSILANTFALQSPDKAGERGTGTGVQEVSLDRLGALHSGDFVRVSAVAVASSVSWTVVGSNAQPWGRCASGAQGAAATAVLQLHGIPPFRVVLRTEPHARFAYFSEVPEYPAN